MLSVQNQSFFPKLITTKFLPKATLIDHENPSSVFSSTPETLVAPVPKQDDKMTWIFDPTEADVALLFEGEDVFPASPFDTPEILKILQSIGLPAHLVSLKEDTLELAQMCYYNYRQS